LGRQSEYLLKMTFMSSLNDVKVMINHNRRLWSLWMHWYFEYRGEELDYPKR